MFNVPPIVTSERCDFYKTGYINFLTGSYMILQKGSPVVQAINHRFVHQGQHPYEEGSWRHAHVVMSNDP